MPKKPRTDSLGDRMKRYEATTRFLLPKRTYTILRVDGRAFHTFTRGLDRPYDLNFIKYMDDVAFDLCSQIPGAQFAYVQSDEVSVLAVDFLDIKSEPWFDGSVQKFVSVGAAVATATFNRRVAEEYFFAAYSGAGDSHRSFSKMSKKKPIAQFDARVFTIPDPIEVENYFVWRQQDAERNSVTMLAQAYATHKQLMGKNRAAQHEIIHAAGDNWAKHPTSFKHGRVIRRSDVKEWGKDLGEQPKDEAYSVGSWFVDRETPSFTKDRDFIRNLIPVVWENDLLVRKAEAGG
jgi:tRNA(His) guanylyltransferase